MLLKDHILGQRCADSCGTRMLNFNSVQTFKFILPEYRYSCALHIFADNSRGVDWGGVIWLKVGLGEDTAHQI